MSKFVLEIKTDNAAFEEAGVPHEVERILSVAQRKVFVQNAGLLLDHNGNTVGSFQFLDDQEETEAESPAVSALIDAAQDTILNDQEISDRDLAIETIARVDSETIGAALRDLLEPVLRGK